MTPRAQRICVAQIGAPHGVRGEVKLWPFTAEPLAVADYGPLETEDGAARFEIEAMRAAKDHLVVRLKGVNDRDAAERLTNTKLFVARERLPATDADDEFYHADLIGLAVVDADGNALGSVAAIHNFGAGDLIEVKPAQGEYDRAAAVHRSGGAGGRYRRRADRGRCRGVRGGVVVRGSTSRRRIAMWRASVLTIFPEMFPGTLGMSLAGKALAAGTTWSLDVVDIRAHATDKHRTVDDTPAGGGPGMVMKADVLARALDAASSPDDTRPRLLMIAARHAADAGAGRDARARPRRGDPVRAVRGRRRAHHRGAELLRDLDRRLRALGRRGRGRWS